MTAENMVIFSLYETLTIVGLWSLMCFCLGFIACMLWDW